MNDQRETDATDSGTGPKSPNGDDTGYRIRAGGFEGPLDLLLHLVRVNEVDITDIPIVEITRQYNEYLDLMRQMNLDIAGEYIVMAATLMHIKSRTLLPVEEDDETGASDEDPRTELAQQLLEYQRYKQAAETLSAMDSRRSLIWTRDGEVPEEFASEELLVVDLVDLLGSFRKLLHRLDEEEKLRFKRDNVSVAEKIAWLEDLLEDRRTLALQELLVGLPTRMERIGTFLAVLEMVRLRMIVVFQRRALEEIRIARAEDVEERVEAAPSAPDSERSDTREQEDRSRRE